MRLAVTEMLTQDPTAMANLLAERDQKLQAEQADQRDVRAAALEKAAELEKEIARFVNLAASGKAPESVLAAIREREVEVAALKATPEAPKPFDRAAFLKGIGARSFGLMVQSPQQLGAALKKLDVDRVTPYPDGRSGWSFLENANLAGLVTNVALEERAG